MEILILILDAAGIFICIGTLLPFIKTDAWWIRVFDFPRLQFLVLGGIFLITLFAVAHPFDGFHKGMVLAIAVSLAIQCRQMFPYTPLARKQVQSASSGTKIKVFNANIRQKNRNSAGL